MEDIEAIDEEMKEVIEKADESAKKKADGHLEYDFRVAEMKAQRLLARSLTAAAHAHRESLEKGSKSSDFYAGRLVWATWALVGATGALVLSSIVQVLVMCLKK